MARILLFLITFGLMHSASAQEKRSVPPPPPPRVDIKMLVPPQDHAFYNRNPGVTRFTWSKGNRINITLKTGVREKYHMDEPTQKDVFITKYGEPPVVPPPPPPKKVDGKVKKQS